MEADSTRPKKYGDRERERERERERVGELKEDRRVEIQRKVEGSKNGDDDKTLQDIDQ